MILNKAVLSFAILISTFSSFELSSQTTEDVVNQKFEKQTFVRVLIVLKEQVDISQAGQIRGKEAKATMVYDLVTRSAKNSQKEIVNYLYRRGFQFTAYNIVNCVAVNADKEAVNWLEQRSEVSHILFDQPMPMERYFLDNTVGSFRSPDPTWGIVNIEADKLWEKGYTGKGVVIGGQDTGYEWNVGPLKKKYRGYVSDDVVNHNYNWHDAIKEKSALNADSLNPCGYNLKEPCDDNNHGTHTMGTMVGSDTNAIIGVAPDAKWIGCRNMERGWGALSTYLECFEWFIAPTDSQGENPDPTKAPHVISNSWSCPEVEGCNSSNWQVMRQAVINLRAAGTVVVVSAGNEGPNCGTINAPAAIFEESYTIGAYDINNRIAGFSSRGSISIDSSFRVKPNVSAPGVGVNSVIRGGAFANFSGTSMAGPHVAGMVALLISANPKLAGEVDLIEYILEQSAIPTEAEKSCFETDSLAIPNTTYGYGRINGSKALEMALLSKVETEENIEQLELFPNPTDGNLYIKNANIEYLEIFDAMGKKVYASTQQSNYINISHLKSGVYFLRIHNSLGKMISKTFLLSTF